jgi:hypothetical protein
MNISNSVFNRSLFARILQQILSLSIFFFGVIGAYAQTIEVLPANGTIKEKSWKGFVVCIELDAKSVESGWQRYMKSLGKFEMVEKYTAEGLNLPIPAISSDAVDFYSKVTVSPRCVQVFMAAVRSGSGLELSDNQKENVRKLLYDFALEQYRNDLIQQIAEAERVVNLAVKAHDKRVNEGNNLKSKLNRNRKEKTKLEKELEENAANLLKLKADSSQNVTEQESALEEIKKVRQIAEEKKLKLGQVK